MTTSSSLFTVLFFKAMLERAVKTACQFGIGYIGISEGFNLIGFDWLGFLAALGGGFLISCLTSVVSSPVGSAGPSMTDAEVLGARH